MAIPESFLSELTARCDIMDIVSRYVPLKKSGTNYFGICPFHNEKTASFSVAPDRQIFHCFGCGAGGGVIGFVMRIENLDFVDAVHHLADLAGMVVPETEGVSESAKKRRETILSLNREAARFYNQLLFSESGAGALSYLLGRGLQKKTIRNFGLGFAPSGWDALIHEMTANGYDKADLLDAGLAVKSAEGRIYDRFRDRVIFPIIDLRGSVLAFGGRAMGDGGPKYLNSPETPVFSKSRNLFALNLARKAKNRQFLLAEGYMDVISLHQAGFLTAVASLGTSLTEDQAKLLTRYADEVVICYDSDEAGQRAAGRAIEILKKTELKIKVLAVPGAKDPDEFISKNGAEAFSLLLSRSENHIEYKLEAARLRHDLSADDDRIAYLKEAAGILAGVFSPVEREIYAKKVAGEAQISETAIDLEIKNILKARRRKKLNDQQRKITRPAAGHQPKAKGMAYRNIRSALAEEGLLTLLYANPELIPEAVKKLPPERFSSEFLSSVYSDMAGRYDTGRPLPLDLLSAGMDSTQAGHLAGIFSNNPPDNETRALGDYITVIETEYLKKSHGGEENELLIAAARYRERKGYGGNKA